ncbi:hypothetical protein ZWY2020_053400 [Hordeum vulgare]|nr:hypothetical protein ZWY2020_053400 [Hordeum vulgare]
MLAMSLVLVAFTASSAVQVQLVSGGRTPPSPPRDWRPVVRTASSSTAKSTVAAAAVAAAAGKPGASGCSHDPNNGGGRCPPRPVTSPGAVYSSSPTD